MRLPDGLPADIDLTRPSAARVYDYFLGGGHHFEIDRRLAEQIATMTPNLAETMRAGRALEPGVVHMPLWRPDDPSELDDHPERLGAFGGVGRHDLGAG